MVTAAMYRLLNLKLLTKAELEAMLEMDQNGRGPEVVRALGLSEPKETRAREEFQHRFMGLGLEALRRGKVTVAKLKELAEMVDVTPDEVETVIDAMGLVDDEDADVLIPGG